MDYIAAPLRMAEKNSESFSELVRHHVSGQLKVAPEHCSARVLDYMGKPHFDVYQRFQGQVPAP